MSFFGFWISGKTVIMLVFYKAHFLNQLFFYYAVTPGDLPGDSIYSITIYDDHLTLYSLAGLLIWESSSVWLLNLNPNLEVLQKYVGSDLFILMVEKFKLLNLILHITQVPLILKWMRLSLRNIKCCDCLSFIIWIRALTLPQLFKLPPRKLEL